MSFTNVYYKRTAATAKSCFICSRPSTTVLATKDSIDFFYTCDGHLKDLGFASLIGVSGDPIAGARKLGVSDEEIQKIKEEWERKQQKKREKEKEEKEKDASRDKGKGDAGKDKSKEVEADTKPKDIGSPSTPSQSSSTSTSSPAVTHERYTLHRDIFAMRLGVHRKRRQATQAKEVAPRLPSAPRAPVHAPQN